MGMPFHPSHKSVGYTYVLHKKHRDKELSGLTRTSASGVLITTEHSGTHIDAICHQALDHKLFGGVKVDTAVETPFGFSTLGAEAVQPLVARCVLLDIVRSRGDHLEKFHSITVEELKECCQNQKIYPTKGDIVLVRTGFGRFWSDATKYLEAAGVSLEGAKWLSSFGIVATGADNMSFDVDDGNIDPAMKITLPCHALLLVEKGIYIIENLNLEELAADRVWESVIICSPLKLVGATGSPVRPIALTGIPVPSF